jgi:hypothetical protein
MTKYIKRGINLLANIVLITGLPFVIIAKWCSSESMTLATASKNAWAEYVSFYAQTA